MACVYKCAYNLLATENRMKRNSDFGDKYRLFMSEYETLGHMEEIWEKEEEGYYTPHHGFLSSSKFRIVFNASSKTRRGIIRVSFVHLRII